MGFLFFSLLSISNGLEMCKFISKPITQTSKNVVDQNQWRLSMNAAKKLETNQSARPSLISSSCTQQ
jgi:hypothetical protein